MPDVNIEFILSDLYYPYSVLIIPAYIADKTNIIQIITIIPEYTE